MESNRILEENTLSTAMHTTTNEQPSKVSTDATYKPHRAHSKQNHLSKRIIYIEIDCTAPLSKKSLEEIRRQRKSSDRIVKREKWFVTKVSANFGTLIRKRTRKMSLADVQRNDMLSS